MSTTLKYFSCLNSLHFDIEAVITQTQAADIFPPYSSRVFVVVMGDHDPQPGVYLLGAGVGHSVAPPVHNHVASSLKLKWTFEARECPTLGDAVSTVRQPGFAGAIVTMPYKKTIIPYLDRLEEIVVKLGACNNVYIGKDGLLWGTNTDWIGVAGCLQQGTATCVDRPALIVGAGGAARAAIHAVTTISACSILYIANRDHHEAMLLKKDTEDTYPGLTVVYIESSQQAESLPPPYYVVGSIPDEEPTSSEECEVFNIVDRFLSHVEEKGILLDMCYKPRRTRLLGIAEQHSWKSIEGFVMVGHQLQEQYRLWCGDEVASRLPLHQAWKKLHEAADNSPIINFRAC